MSKTIRNIVLTGGPCAGKTTAKSWIKTELEARGWSVLFVPETATELMLGGMNPRTMGELDYQRCAMPYTYAKEDSFKRAAELMPNDNVLIVYDRGVMD